MDVDRVVDAVGTACPLPIIELARAARALAPGRTVLLLATDPAVEPDVKAWCEATGHELEGIARREGRIEALVRIRGAQAG